MEDFAPDQAPPSPLELPPIPPPMETGRDRLSTGRPVFVRAFEIEGSTVFTPEELRMRHYRHPSYWSAFLLISSWL